MGAGVWGQVGEEETLEHEAFNLVDPMIQRKQAPHLSHQGGLLLLGCQGERHQCLVSLEGVQGVEFSEVCFEGRIRFFQRGIFCYSAWALLRAATK